MNSATCGSFSSGYFALAVIDQTRLRILVTGRANVAVVPAHPRLIHQRWTALATVQVEMGRPNRSHEG